MPIPDQRDRGTTRRALTTWLGERLGAPGAVDLSAITGPVDTGFSNETLVFDATWSSPSGGGGVEAAGFVVRVAPTGFTVFPEPGFERQHLVMAALAGTGVAVPAVRWVEPDASVWATGLDALCAVHGVDWRSVGLDAIDAGPRGGADGPRLPGHLESYARFLTWAARAGPSRRPRLPWGGCGPICRRRARPPCAGATPASGT